MSARYLMKSVPSTMRAHGGFEWPCAAGVRVAAPDWDSTPRCGGGLHGALNGAGSGWLFCWDTDAVWIVAAIPDDAEVVDLDGKVKVSHCDTVVVGTREDATRWLVERGFPGVIGATLAGGIGSTLTGGDRSTLTGGIGSTLTGGYGSALIVRTAACLAVARVGDGGLTPGVRYRVVDGSFVEVEELLDED